MERMPGQVLRPWLKLRTHHWLQTQPPSEENSSEAEVENEDVLPEKFDLDISEMNFLHTVYKKEDYGILMCDLQVTECDRIDYGVEAHMTNDIAVMKAYGMPIKKTDEASCVAWLMKMYQEKVNEN